MATTHTLRPAADLSRIRRARPEQTSLTLFPNAARHGNDDNACSASEPTPVPDRSTKPAAELVGIARLAASSPRADAKRGTEYFVLPVRSIINRCDSERVPFNYTINPYRGCEFGCHYCYARYTHEFMELDGGDFEKKIYAKRDAGALVARDLGKSAARRRAHRHRRRHRSVSTGRARIRCDSRHSARKWRSVRA